MADQGLRIFQGAVAIVTGGASGIGRTISEELGRRGCEVVLADLQTELAEEVARGIVEGGGQARAAELDVTDSEAFAELVAETMARCGRLDYLFNNAGIAVAGEQLRVSLEDWNKVIGVNLVGVVNGIQAVYRPMVEQGFGHIINTASMAGLLAMPGGISYAATKHAVVGISKSLRVEGKRLGIRVSVFCPGFIRTPILTGGKYGKVYDISPEQMGRQVERLRPMCPKRFAARALDRVARNDALIIEPFMWRVVWFLTRFAPPLVALLVNKGFQDMVRQRETVKELQNKP